MEILHTISASVRPLSNYCDDTVISSQQKRSFSLMWILKQVTIQYQKTAFKIGTIFAILTVAVCTLARSNTFIISTDISDNHSESTISVQDILKKLVPAVDNSSDKTEAPESSSHALQDSTNKTQNFTNTKYIQNASKSTNLNEVQTSELSKSRLNGNNTSIPGQNFTNRKSILKQNTSGNVQQFSKSRKQLQREVAVAVERERQLVKQLTTPQPDDMEVMQKQLNFIQCLLFYIEKEKMESAKLHLWKVYLALKSIPHNIATSTERRIMLVTELLTGWDVRDLTISEHITNELANTIVNIQHLKNLLSITDVNLMRVAQYGYNFNNQLALKQVVTNYKSENALLRLNHELYMLQPRVAPNSTNIVVPLLYYPLLQKYVSLLVDMFSARTACLKVCNFV